MPPGNRPPREEDEAYNSGNLRNPRMRGKFAGVKKGRQQDPRPDKEAVTRRINSSTSRVTKPRRVEEDSPEWDSKTMGNARSGSDRNNEAINRRLSKGRQAR